ncbi:MAG: SWIM zinc finger family protein, partial [Phycisphaeraceae bacterium]|nr:SWIM zinc finger family protein [Phycisphaeraceae bacterium]
MSLTQTWSPFFQSEARRLGQRLQSDDRVESRPTETGELVRAEIAEEDDDAHEVAIAVTEGRANAECTCDKYAGGTLCEHIWALLLELQRKGLDGNGADQALKEARPSLPRAQRRAGKSRKKKTREPIWKGRLTLLRPSREDERADQQWMPEHRQVCYVVNAEQSARHDGLVVDVRQKKATRSGWGSFKDLRINRETPAELEDPIDREIVALLVGADWVEGEETGRRYAEDRRHSSYQMPRGAALAILQKIVETGRAFIEDENGNSEPLRWGGQEPWVLWALGDLVEDSDDLLVSAELRRRGKRVPIETPALVIGGVGGFVVHNGAVAPLDDRGAASWVNQFREDLSRGQSGPIEVPAAEVPAFLQRLYMLPRLPEVDLPDGMGPEERRVEPVPHL